MTGPDSRLKLARPPCVLIFSGSDPSGGAGLQADITAIAAQGAHPMSVVTVLTVQDNQHVFGVYPVAADLVRQQAQVLVDRIAIAAVKIGIVGNRANAEVIAAIIRDLRTRLPDLPVVFDPVLANGAGDTLSTEDPIAALAPLFALATVITPNRIEANRLCGVAADEDGDPDDQAKQLLARGCQHVLLKGGHGPEQDHVLNRWYSRTQDRNQSWRWPRLPGEFHGSGCTLAAALAGLLAQGMSMEHAIAAAQTYCQQTLSSSYAIADGQRIPNRLTAMLPSTQRAKEQE
ncbi:bifunctional hydroxymethylpyrimidine kinase/phosphomethylpyrimidine kinase [Glaciimonas immobilis]|uniref:hydroxymethylpyrimidine kinase n=1 Tax=Glaciimonas immobilis TaxID=728004 RepID=A0A840RWZ7_9BURK|nr:hydroxymethylpyrimidine/phosphomethylpyrimidine kinase [Glaciimonas immobilis]KAF3997362.1 hydroxymethylpyrimidine/phosphomethylpyrimidine kinase [Glaciimonas immobilis]MBB5200980.1 hydroxymethylpyrimidine/phosphomethylpyrimidine kinase [Glaciimonas immobilis]